jgi:prepilin-type N-terminal cleavage/methylation domain-containing protein/prepilin-type processing-associated H-X9-DG protein
MSREQRRVAREWTSAAFTLVELLVVIAIIGILIALLLPAVQAAREAARRLQCSNHLKQIALGSLAHESAYGFLPTGGWGPTWVGDPDHAAGKRQPGGWIYCLLPFIEQEPLYMLGAGAGTDNGKRAAANSQRIATPVVTFDCPTRRPTAAYPGGYWGPPNYCSGPNPGQAKTCYAMNVGDTNKTVIWMSWPTTFDQGDDSSFSWSSTSDITGICFQRSEVTMACIRDGASNTYLAGEKYINPDYYLDGGDPGDDWSMYTGQQDDIVRSVGWPDKSYSSGYYPFPPKQDTPGVTDNNVFGSAHAGGLNMAFCDGSVHTISYTIDSEIHRRLGNRADGQTVDSSSF